MSDLTAVLLGVSAIASFLTHLIWVLATVVGDAVMTTNEIVLAILGTFVPIIGMFHGYFIWISWLF